MTLTEETVDLTTPTGAMRTFVYRPAAPGRYPGVVFFSEIFQRSGPIGRLAALLAGHGYVVAVPEIFHELEPPGTVLAYDSAGTEAGNRHKVEKAIGAFDADIAAALDWLSASPHSTGKLGALGICVGGHLAVRAALMPRVRATATFYATDIHKGSLGSAGDRTLAELGAIRGELMMVWGRQDPHIPPEGRALIYQQLAAAGVTFTWHELNGAHAFLRDEGYRYDPELALLGQRMALDLFHRRLGEGSPVPGAPAPGTGETRC